jgi:hypothetical protein
MLSRSLLALGVLLSPVCSAPSYGHDRTEAETSALDLVRSFFRHAPNPSAQAHFATFAAHHTTLVLRLDNESNLRFALSEGRVFVDDDTIGVYLPGGELESTWRDLVAEAAGRGAHGQVGPPSGAGRRSRALYGIQAANP